ncbi:myosin-2-like [Anneissia japonica]|uniref:myosin-2-like n=1 Tax=Anneissia japonica TaxID=1529436 RepID=UPI001425950C|nr:myosin-2-like [Anneissia japonica]
MATVLTEKSNNIQVEIVSQTNCVNTISTSKCPPQVKKKPSCRLKKGLKVWIHDKQEVWVPACVVSCMSDERIIVKKSEVEDVVIHGKPGYPVLYGSTDWINTEDLALLNPLSEPAVLYCLRERYLAGRYHTQTGSTLVAVNPFKETGLYAAYVIHQYHLNPKVQRPHVYGVAEAAFNNLSRRLGNINQSIIVSGESGAGKVQDIPTQVHKAHNPLHNEQLVLRFGPEVWVLAPWALACPCHGDLSELNLAEFSLQSDLMNQYAGILYSSLMIP